MWSTHLFYCRLFIILIILNVLFLSCAKMRHQLTCFVSYLSPKVEKDFSTRRQSRNEPSSFKIYICNLPAVCGH